MKRRWALGLAALVLLAAGVAAWQAWWASESDAISAAVFREQIRTFASSEDADATVCIQVRDQGQARDPSARLLRRLSGDVRVKPASACSVHGPGMVEKATGRRAVLLEVGPAKRASGALEVEALFWRSESGTARSTYRVIQERRRYVVLGPVLRYDPL